MFYGVNSIGFMVYGYFLCVFNRVYRVLMGFLIYMGLDRGSI